MSFINSKEVNSLIGIGWDFNYVPSAGLSGGLLVMWKSRMASFKVIDSSSQFINGDLDISLIVNTNQLLVAKHLPRIASDHCPILLNLNSSSPKISKSFKFENIWASYPASYSVVQNVWNRKSVGSPSDILITKMRRTMNSLYFWSRSKHQNLEQLKDNLKKEILQLQEKEARNGSLSSEEICLLKFKIGELNSTLARLSTWWKQRAKVNWINEGDQNSKFFHSFASAMRNANFIANIKDELGILVDKQNEIEEVQIKYFRNKWSDKNCILTDWPENRNCLDNEDILLLSNEFSIDEVEEALKGTSDCIAPGEDGVSYSINFLIPKLISLEQAAFIKGRTLHDHILIVQELLSNAILEKENIGVRISSNSPRISHLLYADDVMVFVEARISNVKVIKEIIKKYCNWTGQKVNTAKSGLLFGKAVNTRMKRKIKNILGYKEVKEFCYLVSKLVLRRPSRSDYQFIIDNVMKKLNSWGSKFLSLAGSWNVTELENFFGRELINLISLIQIRNDLVEDQVQLLYMDSEEINHLNNWGYGISNFSSKEDALIWLEKQNKFISNVFWYSIYLTWKERNDLVHGKKEKSSIFIAAESITYVGASKSLNYSSMGQLSTNQLMLLEDRWYSPPPNWIKINVDEALYSSYKGGIRGVARDYKGRLIAAFGTPQMH
ncbi:hypothetical protein KFK09_022697 [Dendrobium nobile]|uniref:Reverse transcriptase domain-containing protein n=1 Tax=Dendrobium nobile TaxID=94219 RepID=A0A8T3AK63_DENNO|nr:hypothetical protein KFK09_022697 [Dendrobium nobile]